MKTKTFKNNTEYLKFINKNREKKIKKFMCTFKDDKIKVIYEFAWLWYN